MIQFFQKYLNTAFGLAFVFVAVFVVAFLGIDFGGSQSFTNAAAVVDGQEITINDLRREARNIEARYREQFGEQWGQFSQFIKVERQALDSIIGRTLLEGFVTRLGFTASKDAMTKQLEEIDFFSSGVTKESMEQFLTAYGYTAKSLQDDLKRTAIFRQFFNTAELILEPTFAELEVQYLKDNTKKKFSWVVYDSKDFREGIELTEEQYAELYEENKEQYREPKKVSYVAAEFTKDMAKSLVPIDQEELKQVYEDRKDEFVTPAKFVFDEINVVEDIAVLPFSEEQPESKVSQEELKTIAQAIKDGADWDNFVPEDFQTTNIRVTHSVSLRGKADTLVSEEREALEALEDGKVSDIIQVGDSFKLVRRVSYEEEAQLPFEEVRLSIEDEIRDLDAGSYMQLAANQFYEVLLKEQLEDKEKFTELAKKEGADVLETSSPLAQGSSIRDGLSEMTKLALDLEAGAIERHQEKDRQFVVYVSEIEPSFIPELDKVKHRIKAANTQKVSTELAEERAKEVLAQINEKSFEEVVETEVQSTEFVTQSEASGEIFNEAPTTQKLFALEKPGEVYSEPVQFASKFYIVKLDEVERPSEEAIKEEAPEIKEEYINQARQRLEQNILASLRLRKEIVETPGLFAE